MDFRPNVDHRDFGRTRRCRDHELSRRVRQVFDVEAMVETVGPFTPDEFDVGSTIELVGLLAGVVIVNKSTVIYGSSKVQSCLSTPY